MWCTKAHEVLKDLPIRDVVSWSALISGYAQQGLGHEALKCFEQMQSEGLSPNVVTLICTLKACGSIGAIEKGKQIHEDIVGRCLLEKDTVIGNALVDMYVKCGLMVKSREVFCELPVKNIEAWNSLIMGYAQLGQSNVVLDLFQKMRAECIVPDSITFLVLLTSCTHAGLFEEGEKLFDDMCFVFSFNPELEHCTCMIDLFCRAGHFDKAKVLLEKVKVLLNNKEPSHNNLPLFLAILGACRKWGNVDLGRWAFEQCLQLDRTCAAAYVFMGNIYIAADMHGEADRINCLRVSNEEII